MHSPLIRMAQLMKNFVCMMSKTLLYLPHSKKCRNAHRTPTPHHFSGASRGSWTAYIRLLSDYVKGAEKSVCQKFVPLFGDPTSFGDLSQTVHIK